MLHRRGSRSHGPHDEVRCVMVQGPERPLAEVRFLTVAEVAAIIADEGINIASLYCSRKQRGKDAFMEIDVDSPVSDAAISRICSLEDMGEARYLDRIP